LNLEISLRNLEHTESIDDKITAKVEKLHKRHFSENANYTWTSWLENDDHISTLKAHDKGIEYFAKASADNLYKTIDLVMHKIESQVAHKR